MIGPEELAAMRSVSDEAMPDTLVTLHPIWTPTAEGGRSLAWAEGDSFPCRLSGAGGDSAQAGESQMERGVAWVAFSSEQSLAAQDRVAIGDTVWQVTHVSDDRAWMIRRKARLMRVREDE